MINTGLISPNIIIYNVNSVVAVCIVPSDGIYKLLPHILSPSGNLALGKPTKHLQSPSLGLPSSLAVDGITDPGPHYDNNCAHPFSGVDGPPVWWYVDLGLSYRITQVVLYNRASEGASEGAASKY